MPERPFRPCKHIGCPNLTRDKSGYCDKHKEEQKRDYHKENLYRDKSTKKDRMEYNKDLQKTLIEFMLSNEEAFLRCQNILKPNYFDIEFRSSVNFLLEYTNEYRKLPFINLVNAQSEEVSYRLMDGTSSHIEWFLDTIQDFCKHKAIELAIMAAPKKIEKGKYGEVEKDIREAILISLNKDLGLNYFKGVKDRLTEMQQANVER